MGAPKRPARQGKAKPSGAPRLSRRDFLKAGAAAGVMVGVASLHLGPVNGAFAQGAPGKTPPAASRGVNENSYEVLENGAGKFKVDIQGCPVASANVESITVEDLVIDEREMTTGADWDYRVYGPGDAHYGTITIRARVGKSRNELYQWWLDNSQGKNIRKSITVVLLDRSGNEARRFNIFDAFPTRWDPGEYSPSSSVACETVVCKMGRVELA